MNTNELIERYARPEAGGPIVYFHRLIDGEIDHQGYITALHRDGTGEATLFDWLEGEPSAEINFTRAYLDQCVFYASDLDMRSATAREAQK